MRPRRDLSALAAGFEHELSFARSREVRSATCMSSVMAAPPREPLASTTRADERAQPERVARRCSHATAGAYEEEVIDEMLQSQPSRAGSK